MYQLQSPKTDDKILTETHFDYGRLMQQELNPLKRTAGKDGKIGGMTPAEIADDILKL
jgi:hypothetical protein